MLSQGPVTSKLTCRLCRFRYLIERGARLDAVNNDGELAIDLAEGEDMETLLSDAMEAQGMRDYTQYSEKKKEPNIPVIAYSR